MNVSAKSCGRFTFALKTTKKQGREIHTPPGPRKHQSWFAKDKPSAQDSPALELVAPQVFG